MVDKRTQVRRLKRALEEIRDAQSHFSDESFAQILMVLLEKLRHTQTALHGDNTPASDEIRLVTVLFLDVKDSTRLARRLDASDWKAVISNAHHLIEQEVQQWDGRIGLWQFIKRWMITRRVLPVNTVWPLVYELASAPGA